ncbi:MAG: hypothetical protein ACOY4K_15735 [Pseudomonadota bacterium]
MILARAALLAGALLLLAACATPRPMPCGCLPPPAEEPAKG